MPIAILRMFENVIAMLDPISSVILSPNYTFSA